MTGTRTVSANEVKRSSDKPLQTSGTSRTAGFPDCRVASRARPSRATKTDPAKYAPRQAEPLCEPHAPKLTSPTSLPAPRWLRWLLPALLALCCTLAPAALPDFATVRTQYQSSSTTVLDRSGAELARLRTDFDARRGAWTALADVSPALVQALLLSEDKRFRQHHGVDWRAAGAAVWARLRRRSTRGASTLSMQLAGLLDPELRPQGRRNWRQKWQQVRAARRLEARWSKDQILEAYLNLVPLRGELVGVDAAARTLFVKAPHGLTATEAALTAALIRAPNAAPRQVVRRACDLLRAMETPDAAASPNCTRLDMQAQVALSRAAWPAMAGIAPHYGRRLVRQRQGAEPRPPAHIASTLDAGLQRVATDALRQQLRELDGQHVEDGAIVVLDNASGQVLAWVGSSGALSRAEHVDGVVALRQPGSTLKPFLYAQAISERRLTAASLLHDSPAQLQTASGLYIPQNYDHDFKGWVSVRTALASSLNVPAVRAITLVSPIAFQRALARWGLVLPENGDYYGYSLALGSGEVTLLALTNAYRALANGGVLGAVGEPPRERVLDAGTAFIIGDILSDANARTKTYGTDSILTTPFWTAVKTGTSKDMRDNWVVGWSARYTVGVWVGNANGAPMWDVSGISGAAPIWARLMGHLHRALPSPAPQPPAELVQAAVRFGEQLEAPRREWFLPGTEQALFALDAGATPARSALVRIATPEHGIIIALDPDIPPEHQLLTLAATDNPGADALHWWLDGQELGTGARLGWLPLPGRHTLELRRADGQVLDRRRLDVRGVGVAAR